MERIPGYLMIIGTVFCISLAIGGYALVSYSPDDLIPREHVCIPPDLPSGALPGYWHAVAEKTGIDPGTADLVLLKSEFGTGGTIKKIELEFMSESGGVARYYVMWYRSDREQCGWSDGIAYPKENYALPEPLRVGPETAIMEIGQIRFADMDAGGGPFLIETHRFPDPAHRPGNAVTYEIGFFRNGTPVNLPVQGHDPSEMLPFSLTVIREGASA
ncbi:MAG: hypothetical protein PHD55_09345 [Methanoregula sp.]|nr:hypothetical protein [Methanoregula sp.]